MPLTDQEIDELESILFNEEWADETLDYFGLHGAVSASVVGPKPLSQSQLIDLLFADAGNKLSEQHQQYVLECILKIEQTLLNHLHEGTPIQLPHEQEEAFEQCLESWCAGFMEAFFLNEKVWFQKDEEVAAELLLPYMALSGLFDHEEFAQIHSNDRLMSQFESIAPEQLTDIYLYYHAH